MKKIIFILAIALSVTNSYAAADWYRLTKTVDTIGYVDLNSIRQVNGNVRVWVMFDFFQPQPNVRFTANSYLDYIEYDCKEERSKSLKQVMYSGNQGNGTAEEINVSNAQWSYITPSTASEKIMRFVCKKK